MCETCGWDEFAQKIDVMLQDGYAKFAEETLDGIQTTVIRNEHVSVKQFEAVENIKDASERRRR